MSLVLESLKCLANNRVDVDIESPIIVHNIWKISNEMKELSKRVQGTKRAISKISNVIKRPYTFKLELREYNDVRDILEYELFDNWEPSTIDERIWVEYFYNLYDITCPDITNDIFCNCAMFESQYTNWGLIPEPEVPKSGDVHNIYDMFQDLKIEHNLVTESAKPIREGILEFMKNKYKLVKERGKLLEEQAQLTGKYRSLFNIVLWYSSQK
jgi:hypothetical protein